MFMVSDIWKAMQTAVALFAEEETHKVDLSSLSNKLLPGLTTLGFKDDRRHKGMSTSAFFCFHLELLILNSIL